MESLSVMGWMGMRYRLAGNWYGMGAAVWERLRQRWGWIKK